MAKSRVLFLCVHNSARSQMAASFLNHLAGDRFEAESAGFKPTQINPLAIEVMKEEGIDISHNTVNDVFDFFKQGRFFGYVITVCHESESEGCPIFPGMTKRLHWSFDDPSQFKGTHDEKLEQTRKVREAIKHKIEIFLKEN